MAKPDKFLRGRLTRPGDLVKAKITALGVRMGEVARVSGLQAPRVSRIISGQVRNLAEQRMIVEALRRLTGNTDVTHKWLFGELAEVAA